MPYSPGGIFSLVASYFANPGTTIRTEQHNPVFEDVGSALSQVLLRDGRAPMTGPLNMNGQPINNVVAGSSPSSVATLAQSNPIGAITDYAGSSAPAGWALCNGQSLSRSTYAALFAVIGTTYGTVDGSSFNIPDLRGRVTAGLDSGNVTGRLNGSVSGGVNGAVLGGSGGAQGHQLTGTQMPSHTHNNSLSDPGHTHIATSDKQGFLPASGSVGPSNGSSLQTPVTIAITPALTNVSINNASAGGDGIHNNVQPTIILNKIIRISYDG